MRVTRSAAIAVAVLLLAGIVLAACGGGDDAAKELNKQQQLDQARKEGARDARLRQLEREVREQKRQGKDQTSTSSGGGASAPSSGGASSCGGGLSVGPNTTCPFAENVRDAYQSSGGDSTVAAASPVTGRIYTMSCTPTSPHVCRGGNNASVFFP